MRQRKDRTGVEPAELIRKIQGGDHAAFDRLCEAYDPLLCRMAASADERYRKYGAEYEDLKQEATLALYKAAMSFDADQSAVTFGLFAKICIRNRMISAGRRLIRQSGANAASLNNQLEARVSRPAGISWEPDLSVLSPFERRVYDLYIQGNSYARMAQMLEKPEKSVDNAVYRIRRKLREQNH